MTNGEAAGLLPLLTDPADQFMTDTRLFAEEQFYANNRSLYLELPEFDRGIRMARAMAKLGTRHRAEMPVINDDDLPDLYAFIQAHGGSIQRTKSRPRTLKPVQCQIYADRSISGTAKSGRRATIDFLHHKPILTDANGDILDGHHRWLTACTIDPYMVLPQHQIANITLAELLPDLLKFSDARHGRNL